MSAPARLPSEGENYRLCILNASLLKGRLYIPTGDIAVSYAVTPGSYLDFWTGCQTDVPPN